MRFCVCAQSISANFRIFIPLALVLLPGNIQAFEYGVITPQDNFAFVGESLRLFCNITNPNVWENSSSLFFHKGIEPRSSQILNTRAIRLMIPEVELSDEGSYVCLVRTVEGKERVVDNQFVSIDIKPRKVENVTCRVYNWETMRCTWNLGVHYKHPNHVNVSVFWVTTDRQQDCPLLSINSCYWDSGHYMHGQHYSIGIVVSYEVKGRTQAKASRILRLNTTELVEPAPVHSLTAVARNSTCILLRWQVLRVVHRAKSFIQQFRLPGGVWDPITSTPTSKLHEDHSSHDSLACGLVKNVRYDFRVAVTPLYDGKQTGFTSEWRNVSVATDEDVPSSAPTICPGCFFDISSTDRDHSLPRKVRILWKDIPKPFRNGILTHYKISFTDLGSRYSNYVTRNVTSTDEMVTSADLELPSWKEDYWVRVAGATRIGESPNASFILVPALQKMPKPPNRFLVKRNPDEKGSGRLFLSWAALEEGRAADRAHSSSARQRGALVVNQTVSDLYIVWCTGSRKTWQCQGELNWIRLPPNQVTFELVPGLVQFDPFNLLIGISCQKMDGQRVVSSGIHWSTCVYTRNQKPEIAPYDLRFSPTSAGAESLVVTWRKPGCGDETAYVTEYLVKFCESSVDNECVGDWITVNVSSDLTRATLAHLAGNTKYQVHVVPVSSAGLGPASENIWHVMEPDTPRLNRGLPVSILIGMAVICSLVVGFFCFCLISCCYRKNRKIPVVDELLDIQPTQKCPESHHHRDRPLPEPPTEDLVDYHTYGTSTNNGLACMKNRYDEKQAFSASDDHTLDDLHGSTPLLFEHGNKHGEIETKERSRGWTEALISVKISTLHEQQIALERLSFAESCDTDGNQSCGSASSVPGYVQSNFAEAPLGRTENKDQVGHIDTYQTTQRHTHVDSIGSYAAQIPYCLGRSGPRVQDIDNTTVLPVHSHWPPFPNACTEQWGFDVGLIKAKPTEGSLQMSPRDRDYPPSQGNVSPPGTVISNYIANIPENMVRLPQLIMDNHLQHAHSDNASSSAVSSQEFCTCDNNCNNSQTLDINANVSSHSKRQECNIFDKRHSFLIEEVLCFPPPPSGPPSPAPPIGHAPPVPSDALDYSYVSHNERQNSESFAISSSEYLDPHSISPGYCFPGVS